MEDVQVSVPSRDRNMLYPEDSGRKKKLTSELAGKLTYVLRAILQVSLN